MSVAGSIFLMQMPRWGLICQVFIGIDTCIKGHQRRIGQRVELHCAAATAVTSVLCPQMAQHPRFLLELDVDAQEVA